VLIVEDDAGVRRALERGLGRSGFDTITVASAREALEADEGDIALVDLGLPDGDGVELCRSLRARRPERPIIVVTGRTDELDVVDALDAGADDFVSKPFSLAVLTARIRRHLDRSSVVVAVGSEGSSGMVPVSPSGSHTGMKLLFAIFNAFFDGNVTVWSSNINASKCHLTVWPLESSIFRG